MEFPRLVYKSATIYELAEDIDQHKELIAAGWFENVPDALAGKPIVKIEHVSDAPPTRKELEDKATELKIKFDGRTTDGKLGWLIKEALHVVD